MSARLCRFEREAVPLIGRVLREVLILCVVGELSYKDTAETLAIPVGTVMSRLSRARLAMRAELLRRMPPVNPPRPGTPVAKAGEPR